MSRPLGVRSRLLSVLGMSMVLAALVLPAATQAAAPPPPPDACLSRTSFNIADPVCSLYRPERGNNFGPIASVQILPVARGEPVVLSAPNIEQIDFGTPVGPCGERGCPGTGISWRRSECFHPGISFVSGCSATDITCTITYAPPIVGDAGEQY